MIGPAYHESLDSDGVGESPATLYPGLEEWVTGYFTPMFLHRLTDGTRARWCTRWWDHAEAIARLTLLWNGWETARRQPEARPGWWLDLDHHLPLLLAHDGPFAHCRLSNGDRAAKHRYPDAPRNEPAPHGWWNERVGVTGGVGQDHRPHFFAERYVWARAPRST